MVSIITVKRKKEYSTIDMNAGLLECTVIRSLADHQYFSVLITSKFSFDTCDTNYTFESTEHKKP